MAQISAMAVYLNTAYWLWDWYKKTSSSTDSFYAWVPLPYMFGLSHMDIVFGIAISGLILSVILGYPLIFWRKNNIGARVVWLISVVFSGYILFWGIKIYSYKEITIEDARNTLNLYYEAWSKHPKETDPIVYDEYKSGYETFYKQVELELRKVEQNGSANPLPPLAPEDR